MFKKKKKGRLSAAHKLNSRQQPGGLSTYRATPSRTALPQRA